MRRNLLIVLVILLVLGLVLSQDTPYKWDEIDIVRSGEITPEEYMTFMKIFKEKEEFIRNNDPNDKSLSYQTPVPKETVRKVFLAYVRIRGGRYSDVTEDDIIMLELKDLHDNPGLYEMIAYLGAGMTPTVDEILTSIKDDCYERWKLRKRLIQIREDMREYEKKWEENNDSYTGLFSDEKYSKMRDELKEAKDRFNEFYENLQKRWEDEYICMLFNGYYEIYPLSMAHKGLSGLLPGYWELLWDCKDEYGGDPQYIRYRWNSAVAWEIKIDDDRHWVVNADNINTWEDAVVDFDRRLKIMGAMNVFVIECYFQWRWVEETGEIMDLEKYKKFMSTLDISPEWF